MWTENNEQIVCCCHISTQSMFWLTPGGHYAPQVSIAGLLRNLFRLFFLTQPLSIYWVKCNITKNKWGASVVSFLSLANWASDTPVKILYIILKDVFDSFLNVIKTELYKFIFFFNIVHFIAVLNNYTSDDSIEHLYTMIFFHPGLHKMVISDITF